MCFEDPIYQKLKGAIGHTAEITKLFSRLFCATFADLLFLE